MTSLQTSLASNVKLLVHGRVHYEVHHCWRESNLTILTKEELIVDWKYCSGITQLGLLSSSYLASLCFGKDEAKVCNVSALQSLTLEPKVEAFGCLMLSLNLTQSHLRQHRTYLTFEQFLTRTRTWNFKNLMMYATRTWTKFLKRHLLGSGTLSFQRWQKTAALVAQEPFLNGSSSNYVEEMYLSWKEDPKSVHRVGNCGAILCILLSIKKPKKWIEARMKFALSTRRKYASLTITCSFHYLSFCV